MNMTGHHFSIADFLIFGGMLLISMSIGIFFAYKDRNKNSTENYYFGGRKMSPIPVALSLSVSFVSAIAVLGLPVEVYLFGTVFAWNIFAQLLATCIAVVYYIPVFHKLQLQSVYEYLELRFHHSVRKLTSILAMLNMILYLGVVVYLPSLALSAVTPLTLTLAIALTCIISTFYTSIGGMKTVIWTDVIQAFIMIGGMAAVFIRGVVLFGGFDALTVAAERGNRNNFLKFTLDPRVRSTAWTIALGLGLNSCYETGCNQVYIQRYLSCKTVRSARIALLLTMIPGFTFTLLSVGNGLVVNAYYEGCDPVLSGQITKIDQSMPRLTVDMFQSVPGMAGLFLSAAYCGTLSTISSGLNALSALMVVDFILPWFPNMKRNRKMTMSKMLTVAFGILMMLLAYAISLSESNTIQIASSIAGLAAGPVLAVFTMGLFMPWINHKGVMPGMLFGWACALWVGVAAMLVEIYPETTSTLPRSTDNCSDVTTYNTSQIITDDSESYEIYFQSMTTQIGSHMKSLDPQLNDRPILHNTLYSMSPFLYGVFGFLMCIISAHVFSFITGFSSPTGVDPELLVPFVNATMFRFGVKRTLKKTRRHSSRQINVSKPGV